MGLAGLKNNLVCFPGIIFTLDQSPSPHSADQRLGGPRASTGVGMVPAAPTAHSGHKVATSALKNHPELLA